MYIKRTAFSCYKLALMQNPAKKRHWIVVGLIKQQFRPDFFY